MWTARYKVMTYVPVEAAENVKKEGRLTANSLELTSLALSAGVGLEESISTSASPFTVFSSAFRAQTPSSDQLMQGAPHHPGYQAGDDRHGE